MGHLAGQRARGPQTPQQPPRLRSSRPAVDPEGFFKLVEEALNVHLDTLQVDQASRPFYTHTFPKDKLTNVDAPFEGVVFTLLSSVPAPRGNDGSTSRRPLTFAEPDPEREGYQRKTSTWLELLTVEFTVYSKSNPRRSELVTWFHKFMLRYGNGLKFFESRGADQLDFVGRGADGFESHEQQDIYFGTLTYQVRIQLLDTFLERQIDRLNVSLDLATN